uniref:Zinc finger protein 586 n=4 Tax=Homininae TaxID=207598 RepID=M0R336_HUMAN
MAAAAALRAPAQMHLWVAPSLQP